MSESVVVSTATPSQPPALTELVETYCSYVSGLENRVDRLEQSLLGTDLSEEASAPHPPGVTPMITSANTGLSNQIERLDRILARIEP